tara:strand:- start:432861 stop:433274 length:414 start_codon:yes stop_codon:yes gene_type:complete
MVKRYSSENPDPIDIHVGQRVRTRRNLLSMSQEKLAEALGITFQQVQKYENGVNRVSSSRLYNIAKIMGVSIDYFFEGFGESPSTPALRAAEDKSNALKDGGDVMNSRETINLVRHYYAIEDSAVRKKVLEMIKSLS